MHRYVTLIIVHAGFVSHYTLYADIHRWALGCCACAWRGKKIVRQIAFPLLPVGYILVGLTVCVSGIGLCNCAIISYPFRSKKLQLHAQRKYMMLNQMKGRWKTERVLLSFACVITFSVPALGSSCLWQHLALGHRPTVLCGFSCPSHTHTRCFHFKCTFRYLNVLH